MEQQALKTLASLMSDIVFRYEYLQKWILPVLSIFCIGYTIKMEFDIKNHHKQVANYAADYIYELHNATKKLDLDPEVDCKTKEETVHALQSVVFTIIAIGGSSIAEAYSSLTDDQRESIAWANKEAAAFLEKDLGLAS